MPFGPWQAWQGVDFLWPASALPDATAAWHAAPTASAARMWTGFIGGSLLLGGVGVLGAVVLRDALHVLVGELRGDGAHRGEAALAALVLLERGDDVLGLLALELRHVVDLGEG